MFQNVTIVGNLGADPELKYMQSGSAVTNFSVATNRTWKDQQTGEKQEEVTWFRVSVFGAQAEACNQYLERGRQVLVTGRLRPDPKTGGPRQWAGQDGIVRSSYEITASTVRFLSGGQAPEGGPPGEQAGTGPGRQEVKEDDQIPF